MSDDNTQGGAEPSPASAGSHVVAWAVVNPSGGTRFLGLTNEDAQREATASERVVPVHWPTLTDAEREAIEAAATLAGLEVAATYNENNDREKEFWNGCKKVLRLLLERTK